MRHPLLLITVLASLVACNQKPAAPERASDATAPAPAVTPAAEAPAAVSAPESSSVPAAGAADIGAKVALKLARGAGSMSAMAVVCGIGTEAQLAQSRDKGAEQLAQDGGSAADYRSEFDAGVAETKAKAAAASPGDRAKGCARMKSLGSPEMQAQLRAAADKLKALQSAMPKPQN